ncbi:hypothetical protein LSG31_13210 [Fodinisporobacter ferrooxydans]|uniref:Uncharacterized protein n=1 Tax=Fodinisporobacter ferrooxydans TaxID=2901836 RepID=A0ABY4CI25_9BACL|nr:hypothetical protein LSG31_13210 [Alicyclobacillaceae bacterium MYW30-H2]
MYGHAVNPVNESTNKRVIVHTMNQNMKGKQMTVEDFIERIRKEVAVVRNHYPELEGYTLYDLRLKFPEGQVELNMEFRR